MWRILFVLVAIELRAATGCTPVEVVDITGVEITAKFNLCNQRPTYVQIVAQEVSSNSRTKDHEDQNPVSWFYASEQEEKGQYEFNPFYIAKITMEQIKQKAAASKRRRKRELTAAVADTSFTYKI
jgi:hypothetical protein